MNFLITGAYGFVGTNLCRFLTERGHVCDALDIPAARRADVPYSRFFSWEALGEVGASEYDCVVHLAGKAHDLRKVASEQSYFDINVGLTQRIYDVMRCGKGRPVFIYFSSAKADAGGNAYGRSKWAAERWLNEQAPCGMSVVVLRPAMIHGPGNKGNLNLLWGVARRGIPWPLAAFENKRSFTSIGNVCAVVETLAAATRQGSCGPQTYFLADDAMLSTNRLIGLIAEACGRRAKLWRVPRGVMRLAARLGDVLHLPLNSERLGKLTEDSFVDNAALKRALGWQRMPVEAEAGMRATLASFRSI